jgi:hypothetical protein
VVRQAFRVARQASQLKEAADLLEQALAQWPPLREEYQDQVNLWRRGVAF